MKNINNNIYVSFEFLALATEKHFPGIKLELNVECICTCSIKQTIYNVNVEVGVNLSFFI